MNQLLVIYTIQIACLIAASAPAVEEAELKEILSKSLDTYNQCEKIKQQRDAAAEELNKKLMSVRSRIRWLKEPCFDEEKIRHYTDNISMPKNSIEKLRACIEFAKITDANERAKLAQKYDNERQRLLAEEREAGKPFQERIDKIKQEFGNKQKPFDKAMRTYCLLPKSDYPSIAATSVNAMFHMGTVDYNWLDKDNKQLGWTWISIRERPVFESDVEKLDNKFYVTANHGNEIRLWAGNFRIDLFIVKAEWLGKERIAKLVKDLVDLEGLAAIDVKEGNKDLDALARDSLACSKKFRIIRDKQRLVVKPLTDERVKVKAFIHRLMQPPADSEQLKKDRDEIDYWKKELETYQDRLEIGTMTDPNERAAMLAKLEAEEKKLDTEKRKITKPYDDQYKKLMRGIKDKDQLLNDAMKGFSLKGQSRYEDIGEIVTDASFAKATIKCDWKDDGGNILCHAQLQLRRRPEIPKGAQMLDGTYYISNVGSDRNFIWVWVGDFLVYFDVAKKEWLGEEKVSEILKNLIDLPRLATAYMD